MRKLPAIAALLPLAGCVSMASIQRHGVIVKDFRQTDGRLTRYPLAPKYLDY